MIAAWRRGWQAWQAQRERASLHRRAIPDDLWKRTLVRYPFLQRRNPADAAELRRLTSLFLDRKEFTCTGGLRLTDAMAVAIAAQAALPVLRLGLAAYDGFIGIVIHPDAVVANRTLQDDDGVVHEYEETLSGEAMQGGPVMLSWPDVRRAGHSAAQGYNVVIHEFAHVLDMAGGWSACIAKDAADRLPLLPANLPAAEWSATLKQDFESFVRRIEAGDDTALDPYGATAEEEFFAVASECFFVNPAAMQAEHAALYGLFTRLYGQDPAAERPPPR